MVKKIKDNSKKWKRSIKYMCGFKVYEEELTYDFFEKHIEHEWCFYYKDHIIDIAFHMNENDQIVYELNIDGDDENTALRYEFTSTEDLLMNGKIEGKTIKEVWEDLEN